MNLFNKYIERIAKAQYDTAEVLNGVEFDAYIDFLHGNLTYQELVEIRKEIGKVIASQFVNLDKN